MSDSYTNIRRMCRATCRRELSITHFGSALSLLEFHKSKWDSGGLSTCKKHHHDASQNIPGLQISGYWKREIPKGCASLSHCKEGFKNDNHLCHWTSMLKTT